MAIRVGRWDCTTCGFKGVRGPEQECPNCGADRPKNVRFYLAEDSEIVQDASVIRQAKSGADWVCSFCGGQNKSTEQICNSCGNSRNAKQGDRSLQTRQYKLEDIPTSSEIKETTTPPSNSPKVSKGCLFSLGALILLFVLFLQNQSIVVTVDGFEWKRSIAVESYKKLIEEDWTLPNKAELINSFDEIHHYRQVLDHYEQRTRTAQRAVGTEQYVCGSKDLGNGYFEDQYCTRTIYENYEETYEAPVYRDEPVYQTKYRYSIYRWVEVDPLITSGKDQQPTWPSTNRVDRQSNQRLGDREEVYRIWVQDDQGKRHQHELELSDWEGLSVGQQLKARRGLLTRHYRGFDEVELVE